MYRTPPRQISHALLRFLHLPRPTSAGPCAALVVAALFILAPVPSHAQDHRSLRAARAQSPLDIDGSLSESAWSDAPAATGFKQLEPREGAEASQRTEVHVLYGDDALYVAAHLHDDHPRRIRQRLARRDQRNQADWFILSVDSYLDQQTARTFGVNAAGVQLDGIIQTRSANRRPLNTSWDAIWTSAVQVTESGWVAELRIPYDALQFSESDRQHWGIQFRRRIPRTGEVLEWPLVPQSQRQNSLVAEYGRLTNLTGLDPQRKLEATPYLLSRVRGRETGAGSSVRYRSTADAGIHAEIGLGSNATLDATVNPDFGQVESDPSVLNLTAFETFFDEKRPFFIEGTDIFDFSIGYTAKLLYTRRIGAHAPVIGALKLTGRNQKNLSYGAMAAVTGSQFDPQRTYGVASLEKQLHGRSTVGGMVTAYDGSLGPRPGRRSLAGAVDWDLRFGDETYQFEGFLSGTHRQGPLGDADPRAGWSLSSNVGQVQGNWTGSGGVQVRSPHYDPNDLGRMKRNNYYRVIGSVRHQFNGGRPFGPLQGLEGALTVRQRWSYDRGLNLGMEPYLRVEALTDGFHPITLTVNGNTIFGGVDLFETRGLWPRARPQAAITKLRVGTDSRRSWQLTPNVSWTTRTDGGRAWSAGLELEWNVGSRLMLSSSASYQQELGVMEWASNEAFVHGGPNQWAIGVESAPPSSLGPDALVAIDRGTASLAHALSDVSPSEDLVGGRPAYYVPIYGNRDTERVNLTVRSNVSVTKNLSAEFFGQLFGVRGRYRDFHILSARDDLNPFSAYPKRHSFVRSSFIANAVVRWQFQPGSELFVVWSQDRRLARAAPFFRGEDIPSPYARPAGQRLTDAFEDVPRNAFIVKLQYTLH